MKKTFRRTSIAALCAVLLLVQTAHVPAEQAEQAILGEPLALQGSRLVFTSWHFVRAGNVGWVNAEGQPVYATADFRYEPEECTWRPDPNTPWGIRLQAYRPSEIRKMEIPPEKPWESQPITLECMVEDDGVYKAWGSCGAPCYLESEDGLHWRRPVVGLVEFQGSTDNNLIPSAPKRHVFIDPNDVNGRYKSVYEAQITQEEFDAYRARRPDAWSPRAQRHADERTFYVCLKGAVSRDGFVWEELPEPLVVDHTDTLNVGWYDVRRSKYVMYVRTWNTFVNAAADASKPWDSWLNHARRCIGRIEGGDFRNLPLPETILEPGPDLPPTAGLYTNCFTWIPRAPECLLMFPAVYYLHNDTTNIHFASSLDGIVWNWLPGNPLIETASFGAWDGGCIFTNPPLMELGDGSFALPYFGSNVPHKYPRGLMQTGWGYAVWPQGRIAALVADEKGAFATVGIIPKSAHLRLNARTKRAGSIRVAVAPGAGPHGVVEGRGFEDCRPIVGDHPRIRVQWGAHEDLGVAPGEPVVLRFALEQAEIFGLEFD